MFANLAMSVSRKDDGVLLSPIIVKMGTRPPGDGFEPYAGRQGFGAPLATLQRHVFNHFDREQQDGAGYRSEASRRGWRQPVRR